MPSPGEEYTGTTLVKADGGTPPSGAVSLGRGRLSPPQPASYATNTTHLVNRPVVTSVEHCLPSLARWRPTLEAVLCATLRDGWTHSVGSCCSRPNWASRSTHRSVYTAHTSSTLHRAPQWRWHQTSRCACGNCGGCAGRGACWRRSCLGFPQRTLPSFSWTALLRPSRSEFAACGRYVRGGRLTLRESVFDMAKKCPPHLFCASSSRFRCRMPTPSCARHPAHETACASWPPCSVHSLPSSTLL